jgi:hypothetical protein
MTRVNLDVIISRELGGSECRKLLSNDGMTSPFLTIKAMSGVFVAASIDARAARKSMPGIGDACSLAKNLDDYQFLICSLAHSLPDNSQYKLYLQKYRVAIAAAFARLVVVLQKQSDELGNWNRNARLLLEETSEAYVKAKSKADLKVSTHAEVFEYFGVPEGTIDEALRSFYEQG